MNISKALRVKLSRTEAFGGVDASDNLEKVDRIELAHLKGVT